MCETRARHHAPERHVRPAGRGSLAAGPRRQILVFGSYARGALNPSDVDLVVEHRRDDRLTSEFLHALPTAATPPPR
ncbi:nucleotidyltransferase domain-containing protein [Streptomyces sp. NPDC048350]|uniref:nucleotidyltransferase domain-containing protein n=1 Tax=Streptomyces sp. NPDC048350 TaxID=3365538 RepID=UPI0037124138